MYDPKNPTCCHHLRSLHSRFWSSYLHQVTFSWWFLIFQYSEHQNPVNRLVHQQCVGCFFYFPESSQVLVILHSCRCKNFFWSSINPVMVSALFCNDEHRKTRQQCAGWQNLCRFKHSTVHPQHIRELFLDNHLFFAATPTYCHETSSLRFSLHRHVNCAPNGQISSLLVLRETPSLQHLFQFTERMSSHPSAPNLHTTIRKTYTPLKQNTGIYTVKYRSQSTCPCGAPTGHHCPYTDTKLKLWAQFEEKVRGKTKGSFTTPQCLPFSLCAYRAGLPWYWHYDTRAERKISAAAQIYCRQRVRVWLPCQVLFQMFGFVREIWRVHSVE